MLATSPYSHLLATWKLLAEVTKKPFLPSKVFSLPTLPLKRQRWPNRNTGQMWKLVLEGCVEEIGLLVDGSIWQALSL